MAKKLFKRQYNNEDIMRIQNYIASNGGNLYVEIWQDGSEDGDMYKIQAQSLSHAIAITDKYYDNVIADSKIAELIYMNKKGECTTVYHTEKNRSGITYEILELARRK